jgi:hypothetical protein
VPRFLDAALEDFADEWLYRPAVGSRWHFPENHAVGGVELARDATHELPLPADQAYAIVRQHVTATTAPFGVSAENAQAWMDESLRPWQRAAGALLARRPYLFGERPALADFGFFGGCAAHFANDPLCRRWLDADAPALVKHTQRLLEPGAQGFGDWAKPDDAPDELIALLAELGRHYLPWVSRAVRDGAAHLPLARTDVAATPPLPGNRSDPADAHNKVQAPRQERAAAGRSPRNRAPANALHTPARRIRTRTSGAQVAAHCAATSVNPERLAGARLRRRRPPAARPPRTGPYLTAALTRAAGSRSCAPRSPRESTAPRRRSS